MATTPGSGSSQQKGKQMARSPERAYQSFEEERVDSPVPSPRQPQAPLEPITTITRIVFHHPMLVPGGYGSPFFNGKEIITFLKTLNKCFKDYEINDNTKKKE